MKKINLLILISILTTVGFAQQFPLQSQYQFNYSSINPATVGEHDYYSARASFRQQWVGLTDNPIGTELLTLTKGFGKNGLGITVFSDKTGGAFNKSGLALSYSHRVNFENSELFLGISAGGAKINIENITDPALINTEDMIAEASFGAYYKVKDFKIGVSIPGLLNSNMEISNSSENTLNSHLYTMISYEKKLDEQWTAYPSILIKTTANHRQIDANINVKLRNKLWFGTSYRQDFGPTLYVGIDFGRLLSIYSHDVSTNEVAAYSNGSHEFTIGYDFIPEIDLDKEDEFVDKLLDRDKDGVEDRIDLCPDEYGEAIANGCPDFDKDGIPDEYDLCPHLFGSAKLQGCPELTAEENEILTKALGDLRFGFDKDGIDYLSYSALTDLAVLMHKNPAMFLLIEGHASSEGTDKYNLSLSARRAKEVQQFFVGRGLEKTRMVLDFYGEKSPLNANTNESERAENRRVEFDIKYHLYDENTAKIMKNEYDSLLSKLDSAENIVIPTVVEDEIINLPMDTSVVDTTTYHDENDSIIWVPSDKKTTETTNIELAENQHSIVSFTTTFDSIIYNDVPATSSTVVSESLDEAGANDYLIVVQVFDDASNAVNYTYNSEDDLRYKLIDGKYYVYIFSSLYREDCVQYRNLYKRGCWIKNP
jgi:type IX secretion system PorP/SprF family membrane protein